MNNEEIVKCFNIDHFSEIPLVVQFKQRLSEFIKNSAVGTRIPPERKISVILKLARGTIRNAMQEFFDKGQITRNGRRGTFVAEKQAVNILSDIHPMALGITIPVTITKLKLLLHENIAYQKEFWKCAVDEFNLSQSSIQIEIAWLPNHIHEHNMDEYLKNNEFDIIQVQVKEKMEGLGCGVPDELQQRLQSDKFYLNLYEGDTATLVKSIVPIHQNKMLTFWNGDLAERIGLKNIRSRLRVGKMLEVFAEANDKLPKDIFASGHIWDITSLHGIPDDLTVDQLDKYVSNKFADFIPYVGRENMFMTEECYTFDAVDKFIAGELLFINSLSSHIFLHGKPTKFKLKAEPFPVVSGNISFSGAIGLCVAKNSSESEKAFTFIEFMLSEKIQRILAKMKWVVPFRRSASSCFADTIGVETNFLEDAISRNRVTVDQNSFLNRYSVMMIYESREELYDIIHGKRDPTTCAAAFMNKWQQMKAAI